MKFLPINLKNIDISKNPTKKGANGSAPLFTENLNMMINKNSTDVAKKGENIALLFLAIILHNSNHINNNNIGNNTNKGNFSNVLQKINKKGLNTILNKIKKIIQQDPELKNLIQDLSISLNIYIQKNTVNLKNIERENCIFEKNIESLLNKNNNQVDNNQIKVDNNQIKEIIDLLEKLFNIKKYKDNEFNKFIDEIIDNKIVKNQNKNIQNLIQKKEIKNNSNLNTKNIKENINVKILNLSNKENLNPNNKIINILNNKKTNFKNAIIKKDEIIKKGDNNLNLREVVVQGEDGDTEGDIKQLEKIIGINIKGKEIKHSLKEISNTLKRLIELNEVATSGQKSHGVKLIKDTNKGNLDFKLHLQSDTIKLNFQESTIKPESSNISQDIRNNVLRQIEEGIFKNMGQGRRQISIKLHPPELGTLKLIMHMHNKDVSLVIHTQNHDVADALNKHIANFEKSFEQQGLKLVRVEVKNDLFSGQENPWQDFQGTGEHSRGASQKRKNFVSTILMGEREIESMDPDGLRNNVLKNQIYVVA